MKKLSVAFVLLLASLCAHAQTFSGTSGGDAFVLPPFRFCLGADNGQNVCFVQSGNLVARVSAELDSQLPHSTVAGLPAASLNSGRLRRVTDGQSASDCSSGGGSTQAVCFSNGSTWVSVGGGSSGLADPGSNGIVKRTALNTTAIAGSFDIIALFAGCSGTQYLGADGNCHAATGGSVTNVSGTANQIDVANPTTTPQISLDPAVQIASGNYVAPTGVGQTFASGIIAPFGIVTPAASVTSTSGGSLTSANFFVAITYTTAAGDTYPSAIVQPNMSTCGGNACQVTVTAPSSLPSGVTGFTVWDCQVSSCTLKKQSASAACVNLAAGVNCVISTAGAGATIPSANGGWFQPANIQADECPGGTIPFLFTPDQSFNLHTWAGVDLNSNNSQTSGTMEICHRTWFTDMKVTPPGGNNAFVVMDHQSGTGTSTANQDRTLWLNHSTPSGDTTTHYGLENLQAELDILATGTGFNINGSPDGEITSGSFQIGDTAAQNFTASGYGVNVIRASYFKNGAGSTGVYNIFQGQFNNGVNGYQAGTIANIINANCGSTATATNIFCIGLNFKQPASAAARFSSGQIALFVGVPGSYSPSSGNDWLIRNEWPGFAANINGPITGSSLQGNNVASFPVNASLSLAGSLTSTQATAPSISSATCSGGASTYTYAFVGIDGNGGAVSNTPVNSSNVCTNPLTSGNPVTINASGVFAQQALQAQFVRIDVYRTGGPMGTGKIGSLTCNAGPATTPYCNAFSDTGLTADGGTIPPVNTTGGLGPVGYSTLSGNKFFVASNFTTAANTNLQTITGLSWSLSPAARNYQFHCALAYSQATANAAVAFGIQAATVNPTNIFATGGIGTSTTAGTTAVLATLASTTPTTIVSATPSATATNFTAVLDGTIEEPANDAGQAINIMVSTATSGDAVTVLRGSYCYLY